MDQSCSLLPHFTALPVTHSYSCAHNGAAFKKHLDSQISNHTVNAADAPTHSTKKYKNILNELI